MSAYFVIEAGTTRILGRHWSQVYEVAKVKAARLCGVVTNESWLRRRGVKDPKKGLTELGRMPKNGRRVTERIAVALAAEGGAV